MGTSLGGWYAAELASIFVCRSVIINPSIAPKTALLKYGVPDEICNNYGNFEFNQGAVYFIGLDDEVIDHAKLLAILGANGSKVFRSSGGHRFHENFNLVTEYLGEI